MLLNTLPILDKGYVAFIESSGNKLKLDELTAHFFKAAKGNLSTLSTLSTLTIAVKCPLFIQLNLSLYNLKIIVAPTEVLEAYIPNVGEVGGSSLDSNKAIVEDMTRTSDALLINPKAYQMDGCNKFTSQVLTPISTYTTLIVHGTKEEWVRYCNQSNAPASIMAYVEGVKQIITMEWPYEQKQKKQQQ